MNESELVQALRDTIARHEAGPEDAFTTEEWADMLGIGRSSAHAHIKALRQSGKMGHARIKRPSVMDGIVRHHNVYWLKVEQ